MNSSKDAVLTLRDGRVVWVVPRSTTRRRARTGVCFYCGRPVSAHIFARIRHCYKHGGTRESTRLFHATCFDRFVASGGRPYNPHTAYEVLEYEERSGYIEAGADEQ
jgi:hypothetical protein